MKAKTEYTATEHRKTIGDREFTVRSLTPNFSEEVRRETKRKIEGDLFNVFRKYMV